MATLPLPESLTRTAAHFTRWIPFAARTAGYGLASVTGGPFTKGRVSLACMQRWCKGTAKSLGMQIEVRDLEKLRAAGPGIIVSNHASVLDIIVLGAVLDVDYKWVAKEVLFKIPFMGWHLHLAGHIPVDRSRNDNFASIDTRVRATLAKGSYVLFFPEGTRSKDGKLKRFRSGAFTTAVRHNAPTIPVVLDGTSELMRKGTWDIDEDAARRITLRVLDPIAAPQDGDERTRAAILRDRTREAIATALERDRRASGRGTVVMDTDAQSA